MLNYKKLINNNLVSLKKEDELFDFYLQLSEEVEDFDNDEIEKHLKFKLIEYEKKKNEYSEEGRSTKYLEKTISEIESIIDGKEKAEVEKKSSHNEENLYEEFEKDIIERNKFKKLNIYQISGIVLSILMLIGGITLSFEVEGENGFILFVTYLIYSFIVFIAFYGFGEIIKHSQKGTYLLEKIEKHLKK